MRVAATVVDLYFPIDDSVVSGVTRSQALMWLVDDVQVARPVVSKRAPEARAPPAKKRKSTPAAKKQAAVTPKSSSSTDKYAASLTTQPSSSSAASPLLSPGWSSPIVPAAPGRTGSFEAIVGDKPHTLLLGTQPAKTSLDRRWYFGSDDNAFWHIIGHALKFRRGFHANQRPDGDVVPSIAAFLDPSHEVVREYDDAANRLVNAGYAIWDILESSVRKSSKSGRSTSMDADIKQGQAARIEELVNRHPSICRIVFVTGKGSCAAAMPRTLAYQVQPRPLPTRSLSTFLLSQCKDLPRPLRPVARLRKVLLRQ